ncbi:DCC1-like thiol-disulfide oxidoreductase family protein [Solimonas soli]|uniref:DCC1-like thiol-disulfide oxidoreductase family protein n=1 Tax=Solimonas soli TaxID=413479 RepID=UPI000484F429|nr:HTTM domain-containing protein [Solimonas soli]
MNAPAADLTSRYPRLAEMIGIDLRTLALFRVALGLVLLWCSLSAFRDLAAFWTDAGVLPRTAMIESDSQWRLSLYLVNGQSWFVGALLLVQSACALMFALGWRMRWAAVLSFVLWASFINRNPVVLIGGDLLLCCLLFWSMFLPLAARYSVDAALATNPPPENDLHVSWATLGLLLQVMSVYFFSAILKSGREWWPDFSAVYYALMLDRHALPLGHWLLKFPALMKLLSIYVYFLELLGPILIFTPWLLRPVRFALMLAFMLMHVGFLLCLQLGHFPFVSIASLTAFAGGWLWDAAARRRAARQDGGLRIYYDRDCGFCLKSVLLMRQLFVLPAARIAPAQDTPRARTLMEANNSWVVIDHDEQAYLKWPALTILLRRSPLFGWLWFLWRWPALRAPGNAVYHFVARHRGAFGKVSARLLPQRETAFAVSTFWDRVAGVFVVLVLIWNLHTINLLPAASYRAMTPAFRVLRIDQLWNMFAPFPLKDDGWWVFPAHLADGREIDLLHPRRGAPDYAKPDNYALDQENIRWLTYRGRLWQKNYAEHRRWYGQYLCRQWNAGKMATPEGRGERLMTFKMVYMLERTPPPGQTPTVEQQVVWRHECYPEETKGQIP